MILHVRVKCQCFFSYCSSKTYFGFSNKMAQRNNSFEYSKTCVKWPLTKRPKNGFQDRLLLNAGQKYCRMALNNFVNQDL